MAKETCTTCGKKLGGILAGPVNHCPRCGKPFCSSHMVWHEWQDRDSDAYRTIIRRNPLPCRVCQREIIVENADHARRARRYLDAAQCYEAAGMYDEAGEMRRLHTEENVTTARSPLWADSRAATASAKDSPLSSSIACVMLVSSVQNGLTLDRSGLTRISGPGSTCRSPTCRTAFPISMASCS